MYPTAHMPPPGFGKDQVPIMPAYVGGYSKRGNAFDAEVTPVYSQARWGNRNGRGGMGGYLSQLEDPGFFSALKQKRGDHGVFQAVRWAPGHDWRGGFGIASLAEHKNHPGFMTRGGATRRGAPKRAELVDRMNYYETLRPGIGTSRFSQTNDNYAGLYQDKRQTPVIMRDVEPLLLRQMIEHNPWHIASHSAAMAKEAYDKEYGPVKDAVVPGYQSHF